MKNIKVILLFFLLSVIPFSSEAQISEKSLFNVVELDDRNFSINELAKVKSIKRSPVYNAIYGVILRSISNSITNTGNGALVIRLPGIKDALIACPKSFNYQDDSNFAWCGDFKDSPGELSLYSHEGLVAGRINIKGRIFEIQPTSKNKGLLLEINSSFLNKAYDMPPSGIDTLIDDGGGSSGGGGEPVVVSVLVLYTSQVLEYQNNPIAFANSVFGTLDPIVTNLDNSLMFNLVGVRQLDDFEEVWNDIELTMNNFVENQTVAYYRDLDRADIVVLLTNATPTMNQGYIIWDPFTQTNLHVLGMANCIDCDASKPYAIVDAPFAINHLTFAHEVSHLFGARHQWAADNTNTYAHAYKVEYDNQNYASLMYIPFVSEQNNTTRQARLSDPDYFKYGQPFGAENADNSRKVESTAVQISNFRTDQPGESIFVNISGPTNCMTGVDYTWVANAIGGSGGYAYQWKVSTNGYKYYDFSDETTDSLVKQFPPDLQIWYLKVEVESSDSKYGCATLVVHLSNYLPLPVSTTGFFSNGNLMILSEEDSPTEEIRIRTEFVVYPNPLKINSIVELFMTYDSDVFFEILDLKGNVFSSQVIHNVKQGKTIININEVPNQIGVYLFKIQTSNEVLTKKVFVY